MGFGSVKRLSKFTADEIAEMGFDIIWTAFEGTESNFDKLKGKSPQELYPSLKSRGVALLSSMIIGFPYHNRAKVMAEFRTFTKLGPSLWQILIYFAFPGTPLHRRMIKENRFLPEYQKEPDYRTFDGFSMHFTHPNFSPHELKELQRDLYKKSFEILGPSLLQVIRVWFDGYRYLRSSSNPLLYSRAQRMKEYVRDAVPGLYPVILFGPNRARRTDARDLLDEIRQETGELSIKERLLGLASIPLSFWTWLTSKFNIGQQPKLLRIQYPAAYACDDQKKELKSKTSTHTNLVSVASSSPQQPFSVESECKT